MTKTPETKKVSKAVMHQKLAIFARQLVSANKAAYTNDRRFRNSYKEAVQDLRRAVGEDFPELFEPLDPQYRH